MIPKPRRSLLAPLAGLVAMAVFQQAVAQRMPVPRNLAPDGPMQVILLGTGTPLPSADRNSAATLVIAGDQTFLVDTGANCAANLALAGIGEVTAVLFTHYHSDHISGLGDILVARAIAGSKEPLKVIGPEGAKQVVGGFAAAYRLDDSYRAAHHGEKWSSRATTADVMEKDPGVVYDDKGVRITMFQVDHHPIDPAVGYRFDYQGKSVVVSGDTKKCDRLAEVSKDVDLLVHEAVDLQTMLRLQPFLKVRDPRRSTMLTELLDYHTSTIEVAEIARDAGVKKLVLTHLVPSIPPQPAAETNFIRGMSDIYSGEIVVGRDGMVIDLE